MIGNATVVVPRANTQGSGDKFINFSPQLITNNKNVPSIRYFASFSEAGEREIFASPHNHNYSRKYLVKVRDGLVVPFVRDCQKQKSVDLTKMSRRQTLGVISQNQMNSRPSSRASLGPSRISNANEATGLPFKPSRMSLAGAPGGSNMHMGMNGAIGMSEKVSLGATVVAGAPRRASVGVSRCVVRMKDV